MKIFNYQKSLFSIFVFIIGFPLIGHMVAIFSSNNPGIGIPEFNLNSTYSYLINDYPTYFNENFGYRDTLIYIHSLIKYKFFKVSSTDDVELGKSDWLFLRNHGFNFLDYYRNKNLFSEQELEEWKNIFQKRQDWLSTRGIDYYVVIAPNKSTIYPEYVNPKYNKVHPKSKLDQLIKYLDENSDITIIDLSERLLKYKQKNQLYFRNDTHWNSLGAYVAYTQIIDFLKIKYPNLKSLSLDNDVNISEEKYKGDLSRMLGLEDEWIEDTNIITIKNPNAIISHNDGSQFSTKVKNANLPKMVMFRDSFAALLQPFLSENFSHATYIFQDNFDTVFIGKEKPDIVIQQFVERKLSLPPPKDNFNNSNP